MGPAYPLLGGGVCCGWAIFSVLRCLPRYSWWRRRQRYRRQSINGLGYGVPLTHAGPAVRVARPARSLHNGEHHRRDDIRHAHLGGGGS